nr:MAG TPA: Protein of unknown function (DUF1642) [Caudoviricetes sp.]
MNKQELIEKYERKHKSVLVDYQTAKILAELWGDIKQLDEPQPIKLKDVIARIEKFDLGTKAVWINEILNKLGSEYGTLKYKDGYEQGKLEGEWVGRQLKDAEKIRQELNKPTVPQIVADYIKYTKDAEWDLQEAMDDVAYEDNKDLRKWFNNNIELFARAWIDGYTVEKEPKYTVKCKITKQYLSNDELGPHFDPNFRSNFTKSDLEKLGLGWVFDCEGMEVEKVGK